MTALRIRRLVASAAGLCLVVVLGGCGDDDGTRLPPPAAPPTTLPPTTATRGGDSASGGGATTGSTAAGVPTSAGSSTTSATGGLTSIDVSLVGGQPQGGVQRRSVGRGQQVRIVITTDRADEAHLRGYERTVALDPGRPAALELSASVAGVFQLETRQDRRTILELEVR